MKITAPGLGELHYIIRRLWRVKQQTEREMLRGHNNQSNNLTFIDCVRLDELCLAGDPGNDADELSTDSVLT